MEKEINTDTYEYELNLGTDEDIKSFFEENGLPNVNPDTVRDYIKASIYKEYCKSVAKDKGLKPCPWCGTIPKLEYIQSIDKYFYSCSNDKCPCSPVTYAHKNKGIVKRVWNRRVENET